MASKIIKKALLMGGCSCLAILILVTGFYVIQIHSLNKRHDQKAARECMVALRKFPYPFMAAMSICSDIDGTTTQEEFLDIQTFLNSRKMTDMGSGVGLEIGNSFLMYAPSSCSISYFSGDPIISKTIIRFIKEGYLDCIHSYGEKSDFVRHDAIEALKILHDHGCKVDVWIDHARTKDNLGDDCTSGFGDHPETIEYHADVTLAHGIKFAWLGRITMITGQGVPITPAAFTSIFDPNYPLRSCINAGKEFSKNFLAVLGNRKYAMHKENEPVKISTLDDNQKVYEFIRFDNYWRGVSTGGNSKNLAYVISPKTLNRLKKVKGYMIVYTHLGKNSDCSHCIADETRKALRNLAGEYEKGNIYVTTTSKLLNYYINHKYLNWSCEKKEKEIMITITHVQDPVFGTFVPTLQDLQGLTFYVPDNEKIRVLINREEINNIQHNPPDYTGKKSVTIPLTFLTYPAID